MSEHLPVGAYVASALEAASIACDSGEDVDRFLDELAKRGYMVVGEPPVPHPGEQHEFRSMCWRCGEPGTFFVAILAPDDTVVISPRAEPTELA